MMAKKIMNEPTIDIFATTNPALCALLIWAFCKSYHAQNKDGCEHPMIFIPVPFCLSSKVRDTLTGTNSTTGFMNWIQRNPELMSDFPNLLSNTSSFTRNGLLFAISYSMISVSEEGLFIPNDNFKLSEQRIRSLDENILVFVKAASKFGAWLGQLGNLRATFQSMGVTL
jgi:hypothetical protein